MKEYVDFISFEVFREVNAGDCSNNGVSNRNDRLYICKAGTTVEDIEATAKEMGEDPTVFFVADERCGVYRLVSPYLKKTAPILPCFGGNLGYSTDSRFKEFTGCRYPMIIIDRVEA